MNQAEHIYRMYQLDGFPIQTIAETIERSRPWVYQKLGAFTWTREYLRNRGLLKKNEELKEKVEDFTEE